VEANYAYQTLGSDIDYGRPNHCNRGLSDRETTNDKYLKNVRSVCKLPDGQWQRVN